jgi:hypothetical protein
MRDEMRIALIAIAFMLLAAGTALAQDGPDAAVRAHFAAIQAEDYTTADRWFSAAFLKAFKADVEKLNLYYLTRRSQLDRGYKIVETHPLADEGKETAVCIVEFNDPVTTATVQVSERIYYYLVREKAPANAPGVDRRSLAWRIDIFDALGYDTLADARRRSYLYTKEAWPDDTTRELKSRQGLFRIQWALEKYAAAHEKYPAKLLGGDNRRDELIAGKFLTGNYPPSGYENKAMVAVDFGTKSSGNFSYYPIDNDHDGVSEGYWLLLHGRDKQRFYYGGKDTVYVLSSEPGLGQLELAQGFASFWQGYKGGTLTITQAPEPLEPVASLVATPEQARLEQPAQPEAAPAEEQAPAQPAEAPAQSAVEEAPDLPAQIGAPVESAEVLTPVAPGGGAVQQPLPLQALIEQQAALVFQILMGYTAKLSKPADPATPGATPLVVHSYGF